MKVSIITPTMNPNPCYLSLCINSVVAQGSSVEHVFVDGGSTNGTIGLLSNLQKQIPGRVKVIIGKDKSAGDAWVKGIRIASGDILGWLGADDTLEPLAIPKVLWFFMENPHSYFVFGGVNYIDEHGDVIKTPKMKDFSSKEAVNNYCSIPATSAFYRRAIIEVVPPDVIAQNDGELEWWLQVGEKYKIYRIESVLSNFRLHLGKETGGEKRKDGFYEYANTVYQINKRHGMSPLSKCALRYYVAILSSPFRFIIDPIFEKLTH